jgi:hypothetical protein
MMPGIPHNSRHAGVNQPIRTDSFIFILFYCQSKKAENDKRGSSTLDDAHDAAAVVLAGVAHRDQPLGGALEMVVRLVCAVVRVRWWCVRAYLGTDQGLNAPAHGREEETHEAHDSRQQAL